MRINSVPTNSGKGVNVMVPKKILFCADFSENSEPARALAADYAAAFGSKLLLAHVIDWVIPLHYGDLVGDQLAPMLDRLKEETRGRLESLAKQCCQIDSGVEIFVMTGMAAQEIVNLANEQEVDLIVIGTHGRTGVKHLLMGSVARSVLKTAHRPVLIVEGPSEKGESYEPYEYPIG